MNTEAKQLFFDRYALKENRIPEIGEVAIDFSGKIVGTITDKKDNNLCIRTQNGEIITNNTESIKVLVETDEKQMFSRIAQAFAAKENPEKRKKWRDNFEWLLGGLRFVPSGRIMAAAGTDSQDPYYNCYVLPSPEDSKKQLIGSLAKMTEIMSHSGGVGMNISSIRPRNSYVKGANAKTKGVVAWSILFSYAAALTEQNGKRKGTLLLMIDDWHPDILEFINAKQTNPELSNITLSINISDAFIEAVRTNGTWTTVFPDTSVPQYNDLWNGDLKAWLKKGLPVVNHREYKAREIWSVLVESIWDTAEPNLFFGDIFNKYSNTAYRGNIRCTNPFGEFGLPSWGAGILGSINLAVFVTKDEKGVCSINEQELRKAVKYSVRLMDNAIDATPYPLEENRKAQMSERRMGIGTIGLADMLNQLGIRYGSEESLVVIDNVYRVIAQEAYTASSEIAVEKRPFESCVSKALCESGFVKKLGNDILDLVKKNRMRNCSILSQAPTGSISTLAGTSMGIEAGDKDSVTPEESAAIQASVQKWMDGCVSKTITIPADYPKEKLSELLLRMHANECKGASIYRVGCQDSRNIIKKVSQKDEDAKKRIQELENKLKETRNANEQLARIINRNISGESKIEKKRNLEMRGVTCKRDTYAGSVYVTVNFDSDGDLYEILTTAENPGKNPSYDMEGISRLISYIMRLPGPISNAERKEKVLSLLKGLGESDKSVSAAIESAIESVCRKKEEQ